MDTDKKKDIDVVDAGSSTNDEPGEATVVAETARVLDHQAEVKLCRKFDIRILPVLAVMCKCSSFLSLQEWWKGSDRSLEYHP